MSESTYDRNTKAQYEALGRFVEAFEMMVNEVRQTSVTLLARDPKHHDLVQVAFHHQALTAKPLFDIMRAIIAETVNVPNDPLYNDRAQYRSVLGHVQREYDNLVSMRNNLLHGTWFIGYTSSDNVDATQFTIRKYTTSKDGLKSVPELPKNADQLSALTNRCDVTRHWIGWIENCLTGHSEIQERFQKQDDDWVLVTPQGSKTTLPQN